MSTKIFYNDDRIIIDGHAESAEGCKAITAMCDSLANDENFKTIVYEKGHAVFERVDGGDAMMFAMQDYVLTARYDAETGYSAAELAMKGTIKKRLDCIEDDYGSINSRLQALEAKLTKTLPFTADELIAKLESI